MHHRHVSLMCRHSALTKWICRTSANSDATMQTTTNKQF